MTENILSMILLLILILVIVTVTIVSVTIWRFVKQVLDPQRYLDPISAAFKLQQEEQRKHLDNIVLQQTRLLQAISSETLKVLERAGSTAPTTPFQGVVMQSPEVDPPKTDPVSLYETGVVPSPETLGNAMYSRASKIAGD